ncbi:hypothetical protein ADK60_38610 [Streptomyces sp. XY431]|uniref:hypothetical protein n=1 Tax=Streptomyces sp. XY431 TaxID=1415562 RepID=UPI0006B02E0F|nr:hypothetical protein [Streptomyces sp. XY431]KOV10163.1 hypothetical protein ADK60_38610 [Streptomyces sp. XY431]
MTTTTPALHCPCGGTLVITAPVFLRVVHPHGALPPALSVMGLDLEYAETVCSTCERPAPEQFGQQLGELICAADNRLSGHDC